MNEDYINSFRKLPDARFIERTHARLEKRERIQIVKRYSIFSVFALTFLFGMLMTFSSAVRADVISIIEEIAGLQYEVTSNCPGCSDEEVTIIASEYLSLNDASSRFPSPIQMPTYVPQGYERLADVKLINWGNGISPTVGITWESNEPNEPIGRINLDITHCPSSFESCGRIVGAGALEEITLNGKPAVVVRGSWNYDTQQYDLSVTTAIQWKYDENTVYTLSSWNQNLLDELIRMAESIP